MLLAEVVDEAVLTSRVTMRGFREDTGRVEGSEFTFREVLIDAV